MFTAKTRAAVYALAAAVFVALNSVGVAIDAGVWLPVVDGVLGLSVALLAKANVAK